MIEVVIYFFLQLLLIYVPLIIKKKVSRDNVLVWSTVWVTVFTSECLSIIFTAILLVINGYQLEASDYILTLMLVGLIIANIPFIKFLNGKLIDKKGIKGV